MMFAIRLTSSRGVDGLSVEQVEIPRARSGEALVRVHAAAITLVELARLVEGAVRPAIDSVFPLSEAPAAFERVMMHGKRGKVVLQIGDD